MPMNGAGTVTPPAGTYVTAGTTIESAPYNAQVLDACDVMTQHVARDGRKALTGNLPFGGFKATGMANGSAADDAATVAQLQANSVSHASSTGGTVDAITLTFTPTLAALSTGMRIRWTSAGPNTITTPTVNPATLGTKTLVRNGGAALVAGDTGASGYECEAEYNGTNFVLLNPAKAQTTPASTTDALTGTDATKFLTPDALAALWERGTNVASAATISFGEGGYFVVTGNITITDIDFDTDKPGRTAWVRFNSALTLTYNASTLILPGAANIAVAAGDIACFVSEGSDIVRCLVYQRASGRPLLASPYTDYDLGAPSLATTYTQAHGLAAYPSSFNVYLECTTADRSWAVGDRVLFATASTGDLGGGSSSAMTAVMNTTNVVVQTPSTAIYLAAKGTGVSSTAITLASWKIIVRVFA